MIFFCIFVSNKHINEWKSEYQFIKHSAITLSIFNLFLYFSINLNHSMQQPEEMSKISLDNCKKGRQWLNCSAGSSLIWVYIICIERKIRKYNINCFLFVCFLGVCFVKNGLLLKYRPEMCATKSVNMSINCKHTVWDIFFQLKSIMTVVLNSWTSRASEQ